MLAVAYGSRHVQERLRSVGRIQPVLNKIFGFLVIAAALAILTGYDRIVQVWLIQYFPAESLLKL